MRNGNGFFPQLGDIFIFIAADAGDFYPPQLQLSGAVAGGFVIFFTEGGIQHIKRFSGCLNCLKIAPIRCIGLKLRNQIEDRAAGIVFGHKPFAADEVVYCTVDRGLFLQHDSIPFISNPVVGVPVVSSRRFAVDPYYAGPIPAVAVANIVNIQIVAEKASADSGDRGIGNPLPGEP